MGPRATSGDRQDRGQDSGVPDRGPITKTRALPRRVTSVTSVTPGPTKNGRGSTMSVNELRCIDRALSARPRAPDLGGIASVRLRRVGRWHAPRCCRSDAGWILDAVCHGGPVETHDTVFLYCKYGLMILMALAHDAAGTPDPGQAPLGEWRGDRQGRYARIARAATGLDGRGGLGRRFELAKLDAHVKAHAYARRVESVAAVTS
jgi:hypothetical protein